MDSGSPTLPRKRLTRLVQNDTVSPTSKPSQPALASPAIKLEMSPVLVTPSPQGIRAVSNDKQPAQPPLVQSPTIGVSTPHSRFSRKDYLLKNRHVQKIAVHCLITCSHYKHKLTHLTQLQFKQKHGQLRLLDKLLPY